MKCAAKIIFLLGGLISFDLSAETLTEYESVCKEIGFKPKTENYGDCVLELKKRVGSKNLSQQLKRNSNVSNKEKGDGGADDATCQKYGFEPSTQNYAECRLKIDMVRKQIELQQDQFNTQMELYRKQEADIEDQQSRRFWAGVAGIGFGMMRGSTPVDSYRQSIGLPPAPPAVQNYTITMPNGRTTNCSYMTNTRSMNCF